MRPMIYIARSMLKESLRSRIIWGMLLFLALFFVFSVYISFLSLDTPARFILNAGMVGLSLVGLAVTILFGLYAMYEEKNRYERYVLLNRIPRGAYLMGKFAGTVLIQALFSMVTAIGIFGLTWYFGNTIAYGIFGAAYWTMLEFSLLMAVGIFFYSMETGFPLNAMLVIGTYIVGHSTREAMLSFIGLGKLGSELHYYLVKALCIILPDFDFFNFRLALIHHEPIPVEKILISTGYWAFYLAGILILSSVFLKQKDI
ncbi:hypothetical protein [Desulfobacula phenolica]|uniref:ABC-type transport system involved in multi-copper enzyme maturation, permease component n=1 Tax=Desulfobacula phenolica TaxID=90732 RepID=A0A1H2IYX4_9BACT|nr:hypothetical protein [Desulfobacula phenolica]SDU49329.1 hypothetical protein SAMN04487931_11023 [Desulfobacula phenolica]